MEFRCLYVWLFILKLYMYSEDTIMHLSTGHLYTRNPNIKSTNIPYISGTLVNGKANAVDFHFAKAYGCPDINHTLNRFYRIHKPHLRRRLCHPSK
jgi:hypothetical protein